MSAPPLLLPFLTALCWRYAGAANPLTPNTGMHYSENYVQCFGDDGSGQSSPPSLPSVDGVAVGLRHSVAWDSTGTVHCWGDAAACAVPSLPHGLDLLCAGDFHTCALKQGGGFAPKCWGSSNAQGQLDVPSDLTNAESVACGSLHNCAMKDQQTVVCWGDDSQGQASPPPDLIPSGMKVNEVSAGYRHSCAVLFDQNDESAGIRCWGDNSQNQLILPSGVDPTTVQNVATGDQTCVLLLDFSSIGGHGSPSAFTFRCWGSNDRGQLDLPSGVGGFSANVAAAKGSTCVLYAEQSANSPRDFAAKLHCAGQAASWVAGNEGLSLDLMSKLPAALSEQHACVILGGTTTQSTSTGGTSGPVSTATVTTVTATSTATGTATSMVSSSTTDTGTITTTGTETLTRSSSTLTTVVTSTATASTSTASTATATSSMVTGGAATETNTATWTWTTTATATTTTVATTTVAPVTTTTMPATTSVPAGETTSLPVALATSGAATGATSTSAAGNTESGSLLPAVTTVLAGGTAGAGGFTGVTSTAPASGAAGTSAEGTGRAAGGSADAATSSAGAATEPVSTGAPETAAATPGDPSGASGGTTSTATSTLAVPPPSVVAQQAKRREASLVRRVQDSSATPEAPLVLESKGLVEAGFALGNGSSSPPSGGSWSVAVKEAAVSVPQEILEEPGAGDGIVFVISLVESPVLDAPKEIVVEEEADRDFQAFGLMTATLYTLSGVRVPVTGAKQPILLTLPVNRTPGMVCAYWDEARSLWSQRGVETLAGEVGSPLDCATTHLTLFAGIWSGFLATLLCTNLEILTLAGLKAILDSDWRDRPIVAVYWFVLAVILSLFLVARTMDRRRARLGVWSDEKFLIPVGKRPGLRADGDGGDVGELLEQSASQGSVASLETGHLTNATTRLSNATKSAVFGCIGWCRTSSVLRDAVDDVASRWFTHFSEVRDLVESVWDGLGIGGSQEEAAEENRPAGVESMAHAMLGAVLGNSAKRQAAGKLGLSADVVTFLIEDPTMNELLQEARTLPLEGDLDLPWKVKMQHWLDLHDEVVRCVDEKWHLHSRWCAFPHAFARLFHINNPFVAAFSHCHFYTCSQRVLFWSCNLLGSVMVATLFFKATTTVRGKRSRQACSADIKSPWEQIGRLLAITLVSLVLAHIPVGVLGSLHCRSLKKFSAEGCKGWSRQLHLWRVQDRLLWALGLPYLFFSAFYILLFLANVAPGELPSWAVSGAASLLEEFLFVPVGIALLVPLVSMATLSFVCWLSGREREHVLRQRRSDRNARPGATWYQVITDI